MSGNSPIGIFDSGIGGLTVLAAVRRRLPQESILYLGDTARVPYGTKSAETVVRYSRQCAAFLVERGVKAIVVACNTASAAAIDLLEATCPVEAVDVIHHLRESDWLDTPWTGVVVEIHFVGSHRNILER